MPKKRTSSISSKYSNSTSTEKNRIDGGVYSVQSVYECDVHDFYFLRLLFIDFSIAVFCCHFFSSAPLSPHIASQRVNDRKREYVRKRILHRLMFHVFMLLFYMFHSLPFNTTASTAAAASNHLISEFLGDLDFIINSASCQRSRFGFLRYEN